MAQAKPTGGGVDRDQLQVLRDLRRVFGASQVTVLEVRDNEPRDPEADQLTLEDEGGDAA